MTYKTSFMAQNKPKNGQKERFGPFVDILS